MLSSPCAPSLQACNAEIIIFPQQGISLASPHHSLDEQATVGTHAAHVIFRSLLARHAFFTKRFSSPSSTHGLTTELGGTSDIADLLTGIEEPSVDTVSPPVQLTP